jgi:hypothetical protein
MLRGVTSDLSTRDQPMAHHSRPGVEQRRTFDQSVIEVEERGAAHRDLEGTASPVVQRVA